MSEVNDPAVQRAARAYVKQQYEKEVARGQSPGGSVIDRIGPPHWDRAAWEEFRAKYGRWPTPSEGDLPNIAGMPDWAFELLYPGKRRPPMDVRTGSDGAITSAADDLSLWRLR